MKIRDMVRDHRDEWPMFMTAEDRQKMLREKLERAALWARSAGDCVADLVKECCCEHHQHNVTTTDHR